MDLSPVLIGGMSPVSQHVTYNAFEQVDVGRLSCHCRCCGVIIIIHQLIQNDSADLVMNL